MDLNWVKQIDFTEHEGKRKKEEEESFKVSAAYVALCGQKHPTTL
jgi:hypothetical protein